MASNEFTPLITQLEARTARFEKQLEKATRKVNGTATRQERRWRKHHKTIDNRFQAIGKSMAKGLGIGTLSIGALTSVMTAGVVASVKYASELDRSANIAGVTAERIQELTFASTKYGISQEKLSDILKDTNDKFGDFYATGAGPLVDFFDNIAPKVGLTADSFRDLSSDKALGLYVKALEDAGTNQQDMTFYMEALASDATALLPLLRNNGRELNSFAKEARAAGIILENDAVAGAVAADRALTKLSDTVRGNVRKAIIEASPEIEDLTQKLIELGPVLAEWAKNIVEGVNGVADALKRLSMSDADALAILPDAGTELYEKDLIQHLKNREEAQKKYDEALLRNQGAVIAKRKAQLDKYSEYVEVTEAKIAEIKRKQQEAKWAEEDELRDILENTSGAKPKPAGGGKKVVSSAARKEVVDKTLDAEIEAIRELGRLESEQIEDLLQERLAAINKAKLAETDKAELRGKAEADAQRELKVIADEQAEIAKQAADAEFQAFEDRKSYEAEIAAIQARAAGRGIEATRIELDALTERYEAELAYIQQTIDAKGSTPQLEADKADIMAGLEQARADRVEFEAETVAMVDAITYSDDRLENALDYINRSEQAKLDLLADYYGQEEALTQAHQDQIDAITTQADDERKEAKKQLLKESYDDFTSALSATSAALRDAGMEDTKAAKAIAKAQQITAIGEAIVNTGQGVTKALALGPIGIPIAAAIGALGAVQVAAMASQTFDGGGFTGSGSRTGGVDGKGGYYAIMHPNEVVADMTRPGREVAGKSLESAFGFGAVDVPQTNYKASQFSSLSQSSVTVGGASITINGSADNAAISRLESMLANDRKNRAKEFNMMANQRDKRRTSRTERKVGL